MNGNATSGNTSDQVRTLPRRTLQAERMSIMNHWADPANRRGDSAIASSRAIIVGLSLLYEADIRAQDQRIDRWQFAVEIAEFRAAGVQHSDLRWLVLGGYAEHAAEKTRPRDQRRVFEHPANLAFGPKTCFVLTKQGAKFALTSDGASVRASMSSLQAAPQYAAVPPRWDAVRRTLTWNGQLIKQYRVPAPNQEQILAAFEEEGWPVRIDDPLGRTHQVDPRMRLNEAIRSLNQCQRLRLLRFSGDGSGQGVLWALITHQSPVEHP